MTVFILFLISLLTRLVFLYFGYPSITNDEADYFINSYLLAKTGSDVMNNKFFLTSGILNATSSIPIYIGSLIYHLFSKSVIAARMPYAFLNSFIPILFYLILNKMTKNKTLSLIGFIVFNFSPWFSYLSSLSAIDAPTALVFYLLGFYILLTKTKPVYKNILFIFFSFLSFNSYMGIKTIFPFLTMIAFISKRIYEKQKINIKNFAKDLIFSSLLFLIFFILILIAPTSEIFKGRLNDKILPLNKSYLSTNVNTLREASIGHKQVRYFLFNKVTIATTSFFEKYLQAFNPYILFIKGDSHPLYGTNHYGLFYLTDLIFFLTGILFFRKILKDTLLTVPFILLFILTPFSLGIMIDGATLSLRAYPLILSYVFFIGVGIYYFFGKYIKNKKIILILVFFMYFFSFIHFFSTYKTLIRYLSGDQWHVNEKRLADKIEQLDKQTNKKIMIHVNGPKETLLLYLFYKIDDAKQIKKILNNKDYHTGKIYFTDKCPEEKLDGFVQIMLSSRCPLNTKVFSSKVFVEPENKISPSYLLLN